MTENSVKLSDAEASDRETDNFEDAQDTNDSSSRPTSRHSLKSENSLPHNLTAGEPSSATSTPRSSKIIAPVDVGNTKHEGDGKTEGVAHVDSTSHDHVPVDAKSEEARGSHNRLSASSTSQSSQNESKSLAAELHTDVDGANDTESVKILSQDGTPEKLQEPSQDTPKGPPRIKGLSGTFSWGQKTNKPADGRPQPPSSSKKSASGFSWFTRKASTNEAALPPTKPLSARERRDTVVSIASLQSNPDLMVNRLDEANDPDETKAAERQRNSLRDRFKMLRLREEAGMSPIEGPDPTSPGTASALAGLIGRSTSLGVGIGSPTSVADDKEHSLAVVSPPPSQPTSPGIVPSGPDANLAPGTVSGLSAGPSALKDPEAPVDWDLWQSVVYEGPAAVAKTSAEELSQAISTGIPSAIRGVVWQVLAQSKNEELEKVYRELVVRGTDKDKELTAGLQGHAPSQSVANSSLKDKQSIASSGSSIKSDHSTAATTNTNGLISPTPSTKEDSESMAKLQSAMIAERKKKAQEDKTAINKLEKVIKRDLGARTSYSKFAVASGLQDGLFGVCKAYALFDEGVGYAQGMNFLVMPLLFNMPEEEAFCLLVRLMNQYHLREMFINEMPGLHLHLYQFERLLEDLEPALYCHLHRRSVSPRLYATQWFLTLFAYRFPLQLVLRIYDLILSEGLEGAILKFGIVLMQRNADTLLEMDDMAALTTFLKERIFDVYIDQAPSTSSILESGFFGSSGGIDKEIYRADILVQDACAVRITPEMLKAYTTEWEEQERQEKEREAELETLRTTNTTLTAKVRSLEERTEKSDTEHVQIASELVRTKVENQELHDNIESLKTQSEELRSIADKQTEEVESRLNQEMERIMQRNSEVQNANRGLEEQMAEMEKVLVETKMQYAELSTEHESIKQKWGDLRKALDG